MAYINKIMLCGFVGGDPEPVQTKTGNDMAKFSICVSKNKEDKSRWIKVIVFGKTAEICIRYVKKGSFIYIEGEIDTSEYVTKDGVKKKDVNVIGNNIQFLNSGNDKGDSAKKDYKKSDYQEYNNGSSDFTDDIPF